MRLADVIKLLDEAPRQAESLSFIEGNAKLSESQRASLGAEADYIHKLCQLVRRMDI